MVLQPLEKYLYWSFGLHLAAFFALLIAPSFLGKSYHFQQEKVMWVGLPKGTSNTLGSPLKKSKGLPQSTIEEQKKALESPPAGEKKHSMTYTPPKPLVKKPTPPRRPGHPDSRIENALARLQKQVATKQVEQEAAQVPETQAGGFTFGSAGANYVSPDDPEYVIYQAKIRQRIMDQWILPMKYTDQALGQDLGLICRIIVHINDKGDVSETEWEWKSGNPSFDLSALRAIGKSSPLDIPPERLKYEVYNEGFIVEFKPTAATQTAQ